MKKHNVSYKKYNDIEIFEGKLSSHQYAWHFHQPYTIIFVEKGTVTYFFKENTIILQAQQILILNPFEVHYNITSVDCEYKVVFLPSVYLNENRPEKQILHFINRLNCTTSSYVEIKNKVIALENAVSKNEVKVSGQKLAFFLLENFSHEMTNIAIDARILKITDYINENLGDKLRIEELSKICCLSKFHFQRLFKKEIGLTVNDYIQLKRTELAKVLIEQKEKVTPIVYDTGYFDQSHFSKAFRKMWVVQPSYFLEK